MPTKRQAALEQIKLGFSVFPVVYTRPDGSCSCVGAGEACPRHSPGKHPLPGSKGFIDAVDTEDRVRSIWDDDPEYNPAIWPGKDFVVLDLDVSKGKDGAGSLARYLNVSVDELLHLTYTVRTTSGGYHLYFKTGGVGYSNSTRKLKEKGIIGVDVRGVGGYVLAPGAANYVLDGDEYVRKSYEVIHDSSIWELPETIKPLLIEQGGKQEKVETEEEDPDSWDKPDAIKRAENYLSKRAPAVSGQSGNEHTYVTFTQLREFRISKDRAVKLVMQEDGWNDRCLPPWSMDELSTIAHNAYKYAKNEVDAKFGNLDALFGYEDDHGPLVNPPAYILADDYVPPPEAVDEDLYGPQAESKDQKFERFSKHLHNADDFIANDIQYDFVIEGWIPDSGYTALLAKRGMGKTTVAVDMVCHIVMDRDWHKSYVDKGWTVVYISAEDPAGVRERIEGWNQVNLDSRFMPEPNANRLQIYDASIDLTDPVEVDAFGEFIKETVGVEEKCMYVLDTWQRMTTLAESQSDEKTIQIAIQNLERLCASFNGPSMILVHPPKANEDTISGTGIIENSSNAILNIKDHTAGLKRIFVERLKGGEENRQLHFNFLKTEIAGHLRSGKKKTAAVVQAHKIIGAEETSANGYAPSAKESMFALVIADVIKRIGNANPNFRKDKVSVADVVTTLHMLANKKLPETDMTRRWFEQLEKCEITKDALTWDDKFRSNRSVIYDWLQGLRGISRGFFKIPSTDKALSWDSRRKTTYIKVIKVEQDGMETITEDGEIIDLPQQAKEPWE